MVGDLGELYRLLAPQLRHIVATHVAASEALIDDACQIAWSRLIRRADDVQGEAALSWLATTAVREAFKLARREQLEISLDAELEREGELALPSRAAGPAELIELRDRLGELRRLPERQQRLMWMHGAGFTYGEIAERTGDTRRTVERQLLRAKGRLAA